MAAKGLDPQAVDRLYWGLRRIRRVEEEIARIYPSDKIKSPVHLSIGQEAVAVGICMALRPDDVVAPTYRGHAAYLAKGGDLGAMMAELYGKAGGAAGGKGGSMHLVGMEQFILGASAVVGTTIPLAVGYALALKREGRGRIAVAFFGDGATEEGVFYESLNFAALHRLPVLFVCENNRYAIHTPIGKRWATERLAERVGTFGIPATRIEDGDVLKIHAWAEESAEAIRTGESGPRFAECFTYRWREHVGPGEDYDAGYRSREELAHWLENDPVERMGALLPAAERRRIDAAIESEIAAAIAFAEQSPFPEPAELLTHVFAS
ncbi:MAG TPA: thiamine pyrophosphate-dependent dehydrogenase E1 component subunit alpha [Stellaceae bacterium]|nr:thiamine pyrophosphate-dependent dehydrogenase E1 component subunit alpha [Stellaceae bacterium]